MDEFAALGGVSPKPVSTYLTLAFRKASSSSLPKSKDTSSVSSIRAWRGHQRPVAGPTLTAGGPFPWGCDSRPSPPFCPCGVQPRPRLRLAHPSSPPLPFSERSRRLLPSSPPSFPSQHPRPYLLHSPKSPPGAQTSGSGAAPRRRRARMLGWPLVAGGSEPETRSATSERVPGGGGARGAQSAVAGWGGGFGSSEQGGA